MHKTFAIYQQYPDGTFIRIGLYTHRAKGASVREISAGFYNRYPYTIGKLFIAPRLCIMGKWTDGELLPIDPN